jgi:hypothetical protein
MATYFMIFYDFYFVLNNVYAVVHVTLVGIFLYCLMIFECNWYADICSVGVLEAASCYGDAQSGSAGFGTESAATTNSRIEES